MSKHKHFALLTREAVARKRRPDRAHSESMLKVYHAQGPTISQASRLLDGQIPPAQRRSLVQRVGAVRGNRELQSLFQSETADGRIAQRSRDPPAVTAQAAGNVVQLGRRRRKRAKARTVFRPRKRNYSFRAKSLAGAIKAMTAKYGVDEWGSCKWYPKPGFAFDRSSGKILRMVLKVKIVITMPRWKDVGRRSKAVQTEWKRFYAALLAHEQGHEKLVRAHLKKLPQSLVGKDRDQAKTEYDSALEALQDASDAYDVQNDHGRKQGTMINTSIK